MPRPPSAPTSDAATAGRVPVRAPDASGTLVQLARAAAGGDGAAIASLYERRFDLVFLAARRHSGRDEHFNMDVVQETFVRVLRGGAGGALARVADDAHVDHWLGCVARSVVLDMLRAEGRRARRERAQARDAGTAGWAHADAERIAILEREMAALPERDRDMLRWRSAGMTLGTIAELLGSTIGSVQGRLRRLAAELSGANSEVDDG